MEEWKFLLQKDGDRSWLPLDAPDAEILEGRYRLVARSSQGNTDIGIRICHLATAEDPPKRRIQKRSSRTNENGLMVVIPFTYLRAGLWEISCFSTDPMSDLMGDTLHHTVCLSVMAPVAEPDLDDWNSSPAASGADLPDSEPSPVETAVETAASPDPSDRAAVEVAEAAGLSMDRLMEMTDRLSHQIVEEAFREFHWQPEAATGTIASNTSDPSAPSAAAPSDSETSSSTPTAASVPVLNASTLRLQLERTTLTASRGHVFTLAGQVVVDDLAQLEMEVPAQWLNPEAGADTLAAATSEVGSAPSPFAGVVARELHLCLRDPQSSTILIQEQQAFPSGTPPLNFCFSVSLPHTLSTYLLLGEVVLYGSQAEQQEATIALQVMPFTVTVDPENLVEELKKVNAALDKAMLEDGSRGAELADLAVQFSLKLRQEKLKSPLDLSFLNLTTGTDPVEEPLSSPSLSQPKQMGTTQVAVRPFTIANPAQATLKQILPPQLHPYPERSSEQAIGKKHLELPVFDRSPGVVPAPPIESGSSLNDLFTSAVADPAEDAVLSDLGLTGVGPAVANLEATVLPQSGLAEPPLQTAPLEPPLLDAATLEPPAIATSPNPAESIPSESTASELAELADQPETQLELERSPQESTPEQATSPIQLEFQSLKLQERFLQRLNQLAGDTTLTASLKQSFARPTTAATATLEKSNRNPAATFAESGAMAKEFVVDDDLSWRDDVPRSSRRRLNLNADAAPNLLLVLPEDTPVPTPVVEILTDDMIAERPMHLRVKLPDIAPKLAVKLWVSDRQTRTLLDGPRWLMDFSPNGFDQLEANLEITAPQGSLEIRIEAISVELQTQRESQKIGLERSVTPTGLPDLWDDDLGF